MSEVPVLMLLLSVKKLLGITYPGKLLREWPLLASEYDIKVH
jgi:hypothetical protein